MKYGTKLLLVAALALLIVSSVAFAQVAAYTDANASLSWKLHPGNGVVPPTFQISIKPPKLPASDGKLPPSNLGVIFSLSVNGTVYYTRECTFPGAGANPSLGPCNFQAPTNGPGDYVFMATFSKGYGGTILAQAIIDPLIEPEWR